MTYSAEDIALAQMVDREYGVPASIVLAQYTLESGRGTSHLAKAANNYFGMRGKSKYGSIRTRSGQWQAFPSKEAGFRAYGELLNKPLYAKRTAGATSAMDYLNRYIDIYAPASDGNYGYRAKVQKVIQANDLTKYDSGKYGGRSAAPSEGTDPGSSGSLFNVNGLLSGITKFVFLAALAVGAFFFIVGGVKHSQ